MKTKKAIKNLLGRVEHIEKHIGLLLDDKTFYKRPGDEENAIRGYYKCHERWPTQTKLSEFIIGMYCEDGGTTGEFSVKWVDLGAHQAPKLGVFGDAWHTLWQFRDLLILMASKGNKEVSVDEFCEMLDSLNIKDLTYED